MNKTDAGEVTTPGSIPPGAPVPSLQDTATGQPGPPLWLLAELTYRCPLHCAFCYNPVDYATHEAELDTAAWLKVLEEARELGSVQCGFSGGEPLVRDDLEILVGRAHQLGYYTNLLTSGVGLTERRADALKDAGLDHVQLSFQDSTRELNDFLSHTKTFDLKNRVAAIIKAHDWPMVLNCVIHRLNIDYIDKIIEMALELGAEYLELANTQFYSWARVNRDHLLPSREQLERAERITNAYREKYADRMRIFFVVPDYYETRPKKCMNGWGNVFLGIAPDGTALPCHTARMLPGLTLPNVAAHSIRHIWYESEGFNLFRGMHWMKEPCASCPEQQIDLGGCRCQAYMLTGDPEAADPVCDKSPDHHLIAQAVADAARTDQSRVIEAPLVFRDPKNSRLLSSE